MDQEFLLPVLYQDNELEFKTKLIPFGYTYRFEVTIDESNFIFEKDDEGYYRVINYNEEKAVDRGLLEAIIENLKAIS